MSTLLKTENICKTYTLGKNNKNQVLKNISLEISEGEFISVMGASGSGKSTLLYNISGMDKTTTGKIDFCGEKISEMSEEKLAQLRLNKMGFVFQQSNLLKNLSIFDNIIVTAFLSGKEKRSEINKRALSLMEQMGIDHLENNDITQVSGGEMQRTAICRALINRPSIVFGDEPTGALNSSTTSEIMDILCSLNSEGTTIMLVTHDAKVAARSDRVLFMSDGQIKGEKRLGKYDSESVKERENDLAVWLSEMEE